MAKTPKEIRAALRLIYTTLLILESFSLQRIKALMAAHKIALSKTPIDPAIQILLDSANDAFPPAEEAIIAKNVDISIGSSDVVKFNEVALTVPSRLISFREKVKDLMPKNKAIIKLLKLDNITLLCKGGQASLKENLMELERKVNITPELTTIKLISKQIRMDVENSLQIKDEQFNIIDTDRTDIPDTIYPAKTCLLTNFGKLHEIYADKLDKIIDYYPMDIMYKDQHAPDYLQKNQVAFKHPLSAMLNIPKPPFSYTGYMIADSKGPNPIKLFTSFNLATVSPGDAIIVPGNTKLIIQFKDMGTYRARYLMIEFLGNLELVDVKLTLRKKKSTKN